MNRMGAVGIALVVAVLAFSSAPVSAQTGYQVLRSFIEPAYPPSGRLLEVPSGRLFGVAERAGPFGKGALLAYDRQPDGTVAATTIHAFSGPDGAAPAAGVILGSDGALYGTTSAGGAENRGTVYRLGPDGSLTVLHSFTATTGLFPAAELVERSDGDLYGTTRGTQPGNGTIFRISKTGTLTVLHVFGSDALLPEDALVDGGDGKLYGVTDAGGTPGSGLGAFYSITPNGVFTVLHAFTTADLTRPTTLIDGRDGFFYGASSNFANPSVFRMSRTGDLTVLHNFTGDNQQNNRVSLVRGDDGHLYGATERNGTSNQGTLFRLTLSGALTTLYSFSLLSGATPTSLIQTADGALYGGTNVGGLSRRGVIFRATTSGQYAAVHMFTGTDPLLPMTSLVAGPDGALYGASCLGGAFNVGTVFRVMPDGSNLSVLHSFAYWDGGCPRGSLTFGHDGALYGATTYYGLGGSGTLFKVTTAGSFTPLYFFNAGPNGGYPYGGVFRASDGNFYGTTHNGGALQGGTIFRMTPGGTLTTLHHFDGSASFTTSFAEAPLMQASNGSIYGGTLTRPFRLTLTGSVTLFEPIDVALRGPLSEGPDGFLYGTTGNASADTDIRGRLFRMTPDGTATVLHTFSGPDGNAAYAGLRFAPDGWFYGSTGVGGASNRGTLFRFSGAGAPVTLHEFSGPDGATPFATLTLGADGALYGTTMFGGAGDRGVIFRFVR